LIRNGGHRSRRAAHLEASHAAWPVQRESDWDRATDGGAGTAPPL